MEPGTAAGTPHGRCKQQSEQVVLQNRLTRTQLPKSILELEMSYEGLHFRAHHGIHGPFMLETSQSAQSCVLSRLFLVPSHDGYHDGLGSRYVRAPAQELLQTVVKCMWLRRASNQPIGRPIQSTTTRRVPQATDFSFKLNRAEHHPEVWVSQVSPTVLPSLRGSWHWSSSVFGAPRLFNRKQL